MQSNQHAGQERKHKKDRWIGKGKSNSIHFLCTSINDAPIDSNRTEDYDNDSMNIIHFNDLDTEICNETYLIEALLAASSSPSSC